MDVAHAQVDVQELADLFKVLGDPTRISHCAAIIE